MNRLSRNVLTVMLLALALPFLLYGQKQPLVSAERVTVAPPSPSASAQELELRGDSLRAQKYYLDAIDFYRAALQKNNTAILHNKVGVSLLQLSKYIDAEKEFQRAVRLDKGYAEGHNNLGVIYYVNRQYGSAVEEHCSSIPIKPKSPRSPSNR